VATDTQRESGSKTSKPVSAIQDDSQSDNNDEDEPEDDVAAFQNKRNNCFQNKNRNQSQGSGQCSNRYNFEMETTETVTENTASTARSRIIPRKNAERELKTINRAKTNKDVPIGLKCT
jgi:hypothetical protein